MYIKRLPPISWGIYMYIPLLLCIHNIILIQVVSGTVAHALRFRTKDEDETKKGNMECTANFVELVDWMLDCLNVGNYTDGKRSRNPFKQPHRLVHVCYVIVIRWRRVVYGLYTSGSVFIFINFIAESLRALQSFLLLPIIQLKP